jgi:predicted kinase
VSECIRRNRGRARVVPDEVILKMAERLVAPDLTEEFSRVSRAAIPQE